MSYKKLLTHRCDVYHLKSRETGGSFGVPTGTEFYYDEVPDLENVRCYFTEKNQSIVQQEPNNAIFQSFLVHFLPSADIKTNCKVVWGGDTYKMQKPRKIKKHHQEVTVVRDDNL